MNAQDPSIGRFAGGIHAARAGGGWVRLLVGLTVLSSTAYFTRIGDSSIYLFDGAFALLIVYLLVRDWRLGLPFAVAYLAYVSAALVSVVLALMQNREVSAQGLAAPLLRYTQLFLFFMAVLYLHRSGIVGRVFLFKLAVIAAFVPLVIGLALFYAQVGSVVVFNRFSSYLGNPNALAGYVVTMLPVIFVSSSRMHWMPAVAIRLLFLALGGVCLVLSGSNSGLLLFCAALGVLLVRTRRSVVTLFGLLFLGAILVSQFREQLLALSTRLMEVDFWGVSRTGTLLHVVLSDQGLGSVGSAQYRQEILHTVSLAYVGDMLRVVFGLGVGQSPFVVAKAIGDDVSVHNAYLTLLFETGIVGVLCFIAVAFTVFRDARWSHAALVTVSGYLLACLATPALYLPFFWVPVLATVIATNETPAAAARRRMPAVAAPT